MEENNENYPNDESPIVGPQPAESLASASAWPSQEEGASPLRETATMEAPEFGEDTISPDLLPPEPRTLSETGLSRALLTDLALKTIYYSGMPSASHLTQRMALPPRIVDELLSALVEQHLCEVAGSSSAMPGNYRYRLTPAGTEQMKDALERCRYGGPAPVTIDQYTKVMEQQRAARARPSRRSIEAALSELVLAPEVADGLGRALHSGRCALIYGPSGNGKTAVLEAFARHQEGAVLVPYAIYARGHIIRVFDSSVHIPIHEDQEPPSSLDDEESSQPNRRDRRWAIVRRPAVIVGGEFSEESLELTYDPVARFCQAPSHVKAQGGLLVVDDFGRQRMRAEDLLNRWLGPLERGWDHLSFHTGEKISIPFDVHLLFATNLKIDLLLDQPFLRRILYKVELPNPQSEEFREILVRTCKEHGIEIGDEALDYVAERVYQDGTHMPRGSYARDLLDILVESARYDGSEPTLTPGTFERAYHLFIPSPGEKLPKITS